MRMYIMLLMALCHQVAARGQTEWHYEYWFDNDRSKVQRGSSDVDSWHMDVDLSGLSETLHAFHFQVVNDTMPSIPVTRFFVKTPNQSSSEGRYWFDSETSQIHTANELTGTLNIDVSQLSDGIHTLFIQAMSHDGTVSSTVSRMFYKNYLSGAATGRYWFDDEIDKMHQSKNVGGLMDIDVSELDEGLHKIHYQVVGTGGSISSTASRSFYKVYISTGVSWRCWFDNDFSTVQSGDGVDDTLLLDVTNLADGFHVIHIQADGGSGAASVPISKPFLKVPQTIGVDDYTCLCMVDDQLYKEEKIPAGNGFVEWNFDVSQLSQGFHRLFIQIVTPSGAASNAYEAFFLRETTNAEFAEMKCVYAIDGAEFNNEAGTLANGTYHFDLDVSSLEDGLHRISYMLTNGKGTSTKTQTQFFMKTPLGGNGITEYWYWLNDEADSNAQKVTLPERPNPFSLISLLPVESQPLRSSLFQFRVEQNKPVVYAKNDIHIRFYDAAGRFTDVSKQYVDESVKQEVTDVEWLEPGVRATTAKPTENAIKWYKLDAEQGDSLQFKLDRAATIQLFSPSGEEVFNTHGSESVKWGGCHVKENGTYYLALHDVTAQQGTTVSIDFTQIGKYAVLAYSPNKFSSDGTTIMYIEGNGLTFVKSLELVNGNDVLYPDTIVANTTDLLARFVLNSDIDEAKTYTLNVLFNNEEENDSRTITRRNAITIEPVNKGDIAVSVTSERRVGDPYPIKVIMKNTGNVGYYGIPVDIAFDHPDRIDEFKFVDFDLLLSDSIYGSREFFTYTDNLVGTGQRGFFMPILVPYLGPYEEKTFTFGVKTRIAHAKFNFYAWAGEPMYQGLNEKVSPSRRKDPPCNPSNIPDVYEALGDADNLTNLPISPSRVLRPFIGAAEAIAGIIQGSTRAREDAVFDAYGIPESERDDYRFQYRNCVRSPYDIARDAHPFQSRRRAAGAGGGSAIDSNASSDCPNPPRNDIDVYIPGDPNEITGYVAESGSHHMTDGIKTIGYDIEFENDPELANSSAHSIIIENQLDPSVFDLSSFTPKEITISKKKVELTGAKSFVTTIDLRTAINAIAELRCDYNESTGKIKWTMTSLDPNTMEPTDDIMQGLLPINNGEGDGIGHVTYSVDLRDDLIHGTTVNNKASIVFDNNDAIETPYWTNIIDRIAPESHVADVQMATDTTAAVRISATDELSGPWRYNVYVQYGSGTWFLGAENVPIDSVARVKVYEGIDHGFYTVVTDSAGNVEQKEAAREFSFEVFAPQVETNTKLQLAEGWNWISQNQNVALSAEAVKPKAKRIMSQTEELYKDARFGWTGDLEELLPTEMYKVQATESGEVQLSGLLFNAAFRCIPLREGWNWIGYPLGKTMTPAEAFAKFEAEEDDAVIGREGLATYSGGLWQGTLTEMQPGCGYMFHSVSDKSLFLNASAQVSSRLVGGAQSIVPPHYPDNWTVDKQKYPNVMGVVAELYQNDQSVSENNEWLLGAFNGDECRGLAQLVSGKLMMNVYGQGGEKISFLVMHRDTGEILSTSESEPFSSGMLGTMRQPYLLNIGVPTGITTNGDWKRTGVDAAYDLQGRKVDADNSQKGIYIMTDVKNGETQKVVRK